MARHGGIQSDLLDARRNQNEHIQIGAITQVSTYGPTHK